MTLTFSGTSASVNSGSRSGSPSASRKSRRRFFAIDIAERFQRVADHEGSHIGGRVDPQYADHRRSRAVSCANAGTIAQSRKTSRAAMGLILLPRGQYEHARQALRPRVLG